MDELKLIKVLINESYFFTSYNCPPVPTQTVNADNSHSENIPAKPGVYFIWDSRASKALYVGRSINMKARCTIRSKTESRMYPGDKISFICMEFNETIFAELFYIGLLCPPRNCIGLFKKARRPRQKKCKEDTSLLRLKEVAKIANVHAKTIMRWIKKGDFPKPVMINGSVKYWTKRQIDELLETRQDVLEHYRTSDGEIRGSH